MTRRVLLLCGLVAPLLLFGTDRLAGMLLSDYDFSAQSMSELGASGSPVRWLVVSLTCVANGLMMAFAVGVWRFGGPARLSRGVAVLVLANAVLGLAALLFFPPQFGVRPAFGSVGVLLMFTSVVCFVLAMILGAAVYRGGLRVLSIAIPAGYAILAIARFTVLDSPSSVDAVSTMGTQERTMAFSFLLWVMALAVSLWSSDRKDKAARRMGGSPHPSAVRDAERRGLRRN